MKRREFMALIGAAGAWPLAAHGQNRRALIGYLATGSDDQPDVLAAFRQGLKETGYVEGQNAAIEFFWSNGQYDSLPELAARMIGRQVDVIAASPSIAALAAKTATTTIPIVFAVGLDPVEAGLVTSLNRPGGNLTGVSFFTQGLIRKRFELLHELVSPQALIAVLANPATPNFEFDRKDAQAAALALGRQIRVLEARTANEIDTAFAALAREGIRAFVLGDDPFFNTRREQLADLAIRNSVTSIFPLRPYVTAGGLMSYGTSRSEAAHQQGFYVGRVLNGERAADLPVALPTRFELVVNLKTAKAIGLTLPESFLLRADEVIE